MEFEKKLKRLEEIVAQMEKGDLSLESSLKLFEEGVQLSGQCQKELSEAEGRIKILTSIQNGVPQMQDFKAQDE